MTLPAKPCAVCGRGPVVTRTPDPALAARVEELEAENRQQRRRATDAEYMLAATVQMLGPKGREVWDAWQASGVQRVHTSWGVGVAELDGEGIAQAHLDFAEAAMSAVRIENVDEHLSLLTPSVQGEG